MKGCDLQAALAWETNPWSHVKAKEAIISFMKKLQSSSSCGRRRRSNPSLSLSWWNQKKAIMDHLSSHSHGSNPCFSLIWEKNPMSHHVASRDK